jgi:hypothetical protein
VISLYVGGVGLSPTAVGVALPRDLRNPTDVPRTLPSGLRRRASALTLLACDALVQAAADGFLDLASVPLLFGSAYGEIGTAIDMMHSFADAAGLPSPTRFHNSVHNTPVSYASIAFANQGFSTALAAGPDTVPMALVEVAALVAERSGDALVVFADEPVPSPFTPGRSWVAAAAALHVSAERTAATRARISLPRRGGGGAGVPVDLRAHPCAGAFAIVDAIGRGFSGALAVGSDEGEGWTVDIEAIGS